MYGIDDWLEAQYDERYESDNDYDLDDGEDEYWPEDDDE